MDTVGTRIEALGKQHLGLTGEALAKRLGVTYETLRKWKRGLATPSAPRQQRLAQSLGVPVAAFMVGGAHQPGTPLAPDEARLIAAYRSLLERERAKLLAEAEQRRSEIEELGVRWMRERPPLSTAAERAADQLGRVSRKRPPRAA